MTKKGYIKHVAEQLHMELGHELDGQLNHMDRVYNAVQCLCFWGMHGTLDGHEHWAPATPYKAALEVVKEIKTLPSKRMAVNLLNQLTGYASSRRPDLRKAARYVVTQQITDTARIVEVVIPERKGTAPAIVEATNKVESKPKQLAKEKTSKQATVLMTV